MGQKVDPRALRRERVGWHSKWYEKDKKKFAENVFEDYLVREFATSFFVKQTPRSVLLEYVEIGRRGDKVDLLLFVANLKLIALKEAVFISSFLKKLRRYIDHQKNLLSIPLDKKKRYFVKLIPSLNPETNASIIAKTLKGKLELRMPIRLAIQEVVSGIVERREVRGLKIEVNSDPFGSPVKYLYGRISLAKFQNFIRYAKETVFTNNRGTLGVKVWVAPFFKRVYRRSYEHKE